MVSPLITAALFAVVLCLSACGRQEPAPPPPGQAQATPAPSPKDELDAGVEPLRKRADGAIASVSNYLQGQSPQLREKFQKAMEKFTHDKGKWREKLQARQKELQPQIDRLKERLGKVDGKTRDRVVQELALLQAQSKDTDQKLAELEAAGKDAWKGFKARLKEEEAKAGASTPPAGGDEEGTPTPKPSR